MPEALEDITDSLETLIESAADYGKTSYELVKLRTIDKVADVFSSLIPKAIVFLILMSCLLFLNLGVAFYLGQILGSIIYGFFVVALFYGIIGIVVHFFMRNQIKRKISNNIIQQALK